MSLKSRRNFWSLSHYESPAVAYQQPFSVGHNSQYTLLSIEQTSNQVLLKNCKQSNI